MPNKDGVSGGGGFRGKRTKKESKGPITKAIGTVILDYSRLTTCLAPCRVNLDANMMNSFEYTIGRAWTCCLGEDHEDS
jgi:hypothetical protein